MSIKKTIITIIMSITFIGNAIAVPPGTLIGWKTEKMGTVIFDGLKHFEKGVKCIECHGNGKPFPKMKIGSVMMKMRELYNGKYCGKCHNGLKAFKTSKNCMKCHIENADKSIKLIKKRKN